jgi:hypothetical protein
MIKVKSWIQEVRAYYSYKDEHNLSLVDLDIVCMKLEHKLYCYKLQQSSSA